MFHLNPSVELLQQKNEIICKYQTVIYLERIAYNLDKQWVWAYWELNQAYCLRSSFNNAIACLQACSIAAKALSNPFQDLIQFQ